jgi:hypothetical protein
MRGVYNVIFGVTFASIISLHATKTADSSKTLVNYIAPHPRRQ